MTGDNVIDASRKSVCLKAHLASTGSYFDAVNVLSATVRVEWEVESFARQQTSSGLGARLHWQRWRSTSSKEKRSKSKAWLLRKARWSDMLVLIKWQGRTMAVLLSQLQPIKGNKATNEAITHWHYSVAQGYCFLTHRRPECASLPKAHSAPKARRFWGPKAATPGSDSRWHA
jgi:hypothetical protein